MHTYEYAKLITRALFSSLGAGLVFTSGPANVAHATLTPVPLVPEAWDIQVDALGESTFGTHKGAESLCLRGALALLRDINLSEGTIAYDVSFKNQRGFVGAVFHAEDAFTHERFFMRPQQSGTIDSIQYTPVFGGFQTWKLYYGEGFNGAYDFDFEGWNSVKLEIADGKMAVYVGDMETPLYEVPELKHNRDAGQLGLFALNPQRVEGCFSNVRYSLEKPDLSFIASPQPSTDPDLITRWQVSEPVNQAQFENLTNLGEVDLEELNWQTLDTDFSGVLNITRYFPLQPQANAVVVRLNIPAEEARLQAFDFGYSDYASVYHNGQLLYSGNNSFQSRNELYIGTIGFYESLYLPLEPGDNQVVIVLSTSARGTAGWGLMGRFAP
ncbi:MAG: hypothetical protein ACO4CG_13395 [Prochlorothrix sp.]